LVGGLAADSEVLDLGAGTGKLTRVLARRFAQVTAVEPDESMRAVAVLATSCCKVIEGSAEGIPLPDQSVDGVFCADCFHWFDWPAALEEIERALRPRGVLVLCFHQSNGETEPPFPEAANDAIERCRRPGIEPGGVIYQSGAWREPFEGSSFEPLREEVFEQEAWLGREEMVSLGLSQSVCAVLPDDERAALGAELLGLIPDVTFRLPLRAEVYWTRLQ
jgi:SAM-dependent methyltransferase